MSRVLIVGATGKLGVALRRYWADCPPAGLEPVWLSRADLEAPVPEADAVIALWGVTQGTPEELARNVALAEAARVLAKAAGAERVLHLSSAAVYGAARAATEATELAPRGAYGQAKADMEARVALFAAAPRNCVLRLANVAGCDSIFHTLAAGGVATLDRFEDGAGPRRSYIGMPAFGAVLEALLTQPLAALPSVLNVAQPEAVGMEDIVIAAGAELVWVPARAGAVQDVTLDVSALSAIVALPAACAEALVASWRDYGGQP